MTELSTRAQRRRVLKSAQIVFNGGHSTIDCVVRNVSDTGALVRIEGALNMPGEFDLIVDDVRRPCRVAWRKVTELGVAFVVD